MKPRENPRRLLFAKLYVIYQFNGTKAAIAAGCARKSADVEAAGRLGNARVKAHITAFVAKLSEQLELDALEVMRINAAIARANITQVYGPNREWLHPTEWPPELKIAAKKFKVRVENLTSGDGKQDQTVEVELEGKHAAIERDYKRHQLLVERLERVWF